MALNAETEKWWWLWTSKTNNTTLNVKLRNVTLNVKLKTDDGSERRNQKCDDGGSERWKLRMRHWTSNWEMRIWTSNWKPMMALNAKTQKRQWWLWTPKLKSDNDGSERQHWEVITMALNAERRCDDGSEHRNRECDSERQTRKWWWLWTPKRSETWLWAPKLRSDALNVETEKLWWLWTPKTGEVALNAKLKVWHDDSECRKPWMNGGSERQTARKWWGGNMPQCSIPPQCSIQRKWLKGTLRVSNNAPLASRDNQIDYEHSLTTLPTKSWGLNLKVTIQWRVMASRAIRTWTLRSTKSSSWRKSQEQQSVRQIQYISTEWWKLQWICERTIASMTKWGKYVPV